VVFADTNQGKQNKINTNMIFCFIIKNVIPLLIIKSSIEEIFPPMRMVNILQEESNNYQEKIGFELYETNGKFKMVLNLYLKQATLTE
jgi:hypothetical protein